MQDSLVQLQCLKEACKCAGFSYTERDENGNLVEVETPKGKLLFANFATPFNTGSVEQICKDKDFMYRMVREDVRTPRTIGYFDPDYRGGYERFKKFKELKKIVSDIESKFAYPLVVKRNSGACGGNVFLCEDTNAALAAFSKIFAKDSPDYDYVALAQEYVKPEIEYRAVVFRNKPVLVYRKDISHATFNGNLSPLHHEGARAVPSVEAELVKRIGDFIAPVFKRIPVVFAGFDIVEDKRKTLWLIEINTRPGLALFIRDNSKKLVIQMYQKLLKPLD